ncbi:protein chlororespiratory reduction 7, chloroplastic [Tanacetum coccineum]
MMRSSNSLHCLKDKVKADVIKVPELLANVFSEDSDAVLCVTTGTSLPHDLAISESIDDDVTSLVKSVCELEIDGDVHSIRWYDLLQNEDHSSNLLLQN